MKKNTGKRHKPYFCIVKMQVSLYGQSSTLIYNRIKTVQNICKRDVGESWLGERHKGYFLAKITRDRIKIIKEVKEKIW